MAVILASGVTIGAAKRAALQRIILPARTPSLHCARITTTWLLRPNQHASIDSLPAKFTELFILGR